MFNGLRLFFLSFFVFCTNTNTVDAWRHLRPSQPKHRESSIVIVLYHSCYNGY
jgi:hypothetical protein